MSVLGIMWMDGSDSEVQASPARVPRSASVSGEEVYCYRDGLDTCQDLRGEQRVFAPEAVRQSVIVPVKEPSGSCLVIPWAPIRVTFGEALVLLPPFPIFIYPMPLHLAGCSSWELLRIDAAD
jgi:hypothetical protein